MEKITEQTKEESKVNLSQNVKKLNKKQLKQAFDNKLISSDEYKNKLFEIETSTEKKKRKEKRLPKSLTPEEFKELINVIPDKDKISRTAFLLAYGSGLRISEIVGGVNKDSKIMPLDSSNFQLDVKPQQIKIFGKYSKERIVPVPKGWKEFMFKVIPIKLTPRSLERRFKNYSKKANLDSKYSFHSLRHGFATRLVESGVPISHVQNLMGHDNLATTSIYSKARPKDALKSYEDLF